VVLRSSCGFYSQAWRFTHHPITPSRADFLVSLLTGRGFFINSIERPARGLDRALDWVQIRGEYVLSSEEYPVAKLEQAIACDNGERAAGMIQEALGIESAEVANSQVIPMSFPCHGRRIASSAPALLASGCRPKRVF
jgi:hypothetical protein